MTNKSSENQEKQKNHRTTGKQKKPIFAIHVNSCISAVLCVAGLISSGAISLYREEASQDRTLTVEQIQARRQGLAERLKNDPHMPAQAKAIMMGQLNQKKEMAPTQAIR